VVSSHFANKLCVGNQYQEQKFALRKIDIQIVCIFYKKTAKINNRFHH